MPCTLERQMSVTEGVDVPALDAILFLSPRRSQIDVVQAVGRAMRKSPGKKYGYIVIPITVPATESYERIVLDRRFNPTFQVLQALKSHDEDFYDTINQADLRDNKKVSVCIFGSGSGTSSNGASGSGSSDVGEVGGVQPELELEVSDNVREAIYARIVDSLTDKHYYKKWAEETARINAQYEERIKGLLATDRNGVRSEFTKFHAAIRRDLNDGITEDKAISLLAQHLVTRPIFDALFSEFEFAQNNPVSRAMDGMANALRFEHGTRSARLRNWWASIRAFSVVYGMWILRRRSSASSRTCIRTSSRPHSRRTRTRSGSCTTPVEAVDFIIRSVEDILNEDFGASLSDEGVNVLDPFVGTGTFISRLLSSGIIRPEDMLRIYSQEIHANDIILLAYYIATVNIEMTFHDMAKAANYAPFNGIVFADSFEAQENRVAPRIGGEFLEANNERMTDQNKKDIQVIIGNPPWSSGQGSVNDDNANRVYPALRGRISETYAQESTTQNRILTLRHLHPSHPHGVR